MNTVLILNSSGRVLTHSVFTSQGFGTTVLDLNGNVDGLLLISSEWLNDNTIVILCLAFFIFYLIFSKLNVSQRF